MNVLDLFSGIGGFSLGLERAGMRTVAFCEIEPFARRVLAERWPGVPIYDDVRTLTADRLRADGIVPDVICGGFPCQDISLAGKGAGIAEGTRSGLWSEIARLSSELRPQYVIVENVSALLGRGIDRVLGDLAAIGYDAEWHCIPASALGAPHRRDRFWLVAYPESARAPERGEYPGRLGSNLNNYAYGADTNAPSERRHEEGQLRHIEPAERPASLREEMANPHVEGLEERERKDAGGTRPIFRPLIERNAAWAVEPDVGRVADGVPSRVDRLKALGNAVIPQIPEIIGRAIMTASALPSTNRATTKEA